MLAGGRKLDTISKSPLGVLCASGMLCNRVGTGQLFVRSSFDKDSTDKPRIPCNVTCLSTPTNAMHFILAAGILEIQSMVARHAVLGLFVYVEMWFGSACRTMDHSTRAPLTMYSANSIKPKKLNGYHSP